MERIRVKVRGVFDQIVLKLKEARQKLNEIGFSRDQVMAVAIVVFALAVVVVSLIAISIEQRQHIQVKVSEKEVLVKAWESLMLLYRDIGLQAPDQLRRDGTALSQFEEIAGVPDLAEFIALIEQGNLQEAAEKARWLDANFLEEARAKRANVKWFWTASLFFAYIQPFYAPHTESVALQPAAAPMEQVQPTAVSQAEAAIAVATEPTKTNKPSTVERVILGLIQPRNSFSGGGNKAGVGAGGGGGGAGGGSGSASGSDKALSEQSAESILPVEPALSENWLIDFIKNNQPAPPAPTQAIPKLPTDLPNNWPTPTPILTGPGGRGAGGGGGGAG